MQTAGLSDRELAPSVVGVDGELVSSGADVGGELVSVGVDVDGELVSSVGVGVTPLSHDSISEPRSSDHLRFSLADSTALFAASVAAPSSWSLTNVSNCQE
jgi:hypothetical protein